MILNAPAPSSSRSLWARAALWGVAIELLLVPFCLGLAQLSGHHDLVLLRLLALTLQMPGILVGVAVHPSAGPVLATAATVLAQAGVWTVLAHRILSARERVGSGRVRRIASRLDPAGPRHAALRRRAPAFLRAGNGALPRGTERVPALSWPRCFGYGALCALGTLVLAAVVEPLPFSAFDQAGSSQLIALPLRFPGNLLAVAAGVPHDAFAFLLPVQTLFWAAAWRWLISPRSRRPA